MQVVGPVIVDLLVFAHQFLRYFAICVNVLNVDLVLNLHSGHTLI